MGDKISFVCPTLNRKALQTRLTDSIFKNADNPKDIEIIFGINNDDPIALETAEELKAVYGHDSIKVNLVSPDEKLPNISNLCALEASGDIIGNIADDVVIESINWDVTVREAFSNYPDGILLLWSDCGHWNGALAAHYFVHKNWVKVLGHIQPTFFHADWTDHWNQTLASKLGRAKLITDKSKLFLRHLHAEFGEMEKDETYWKVKAKREENVTEGLTFHNPTPEMTEAFDEQFNKLKKHIEEYKDE